MDNSRIKQIGWIAALVYFSQGALGVSAVALPLFLRSLGWSVAEITSLTSLVSFPWVLKILYGLISDNYPLFGYRRKTYLILCSILAVTGWGGLALAAESKSLIFVWMVVAHFGFAATDVITDGLIVEHSSEETSHVFQSIAWGARSVGAIASGVLGGWLAGRFPASTVFLLTACLPILVLLGALVLKEEKSKKESTSLTEPLKDCWKLLTTSNLKWFLLFLFIMGVPACFTTPFFFYMKEDLAFKETFLGVLISLGWIGALIGSFAYGKYLKKIPIQKLLKFAIYLSCFNILSTLMIRNEVLAIALVTVSGILGCLALLPMMSSSAILTSNTGVEGTTFAVLMSVYNLSQMFFGFLGGKLLPYVGLQALIVGSSFLILSGAYVASRINFSVAMPVSSD